MIQTIEFLPPRYRQRRVARRNVVRRMGAAAVAAAGIAAASIWQHGEARQVRQELTKLEAQEQVVQSSSRRLEELRWELANARAAAELCVFLERPWPRTRIFSAVANAAPGEVELTALTISQEASDPANSSGRSPGAASKTRTTVDEGPPALRDLRRLFAESGRTRTVVRVAGAAADPIAVHRFVENLSRDPLFARTELSSLESIEQPERGIIARFETRIVLRDEYGPAPEGKPAGAAALRTARYAP